MESLFFLLPVSPPPPNQKSSLWERANRLNQSEGLDFKTVKMVVYLLTIACFSVKLQAVVH